MQTMKARREGKDGAIFGEKFYQFGFGQTSKIFHPNLTPSLTSMSYK